MTVVDYSMGQEHALVLTDEGRVYAWGRGDCGRLGTTTDETELVPKVILKVMESGLG